MIVEDPRGMRLAKASGRARAKIDLAACLVMAHVAPPGARPTENDAR